MARQQVDDGSVNTGITPVAAPVNTYVRPAADPAAGKDLEALATSLRGFAPVLDQYLDNQAELGKQKAAEAGQEAFYQGNKDGYTAAVSSGAIPAWASPFAARAYSQAQGDAYGGQVALQWQTAYDQWPSKNEVGPQAAADFAKFQQQFLKDRVPDGADQWFLKGLLPHLHATAQAGSTAFGQDQHVQLVKGLTNAAGTSANQAIDQQIAAGTGQPAGINYDATFATMQKIRQDLLATGTVTPEEASAQMAEAAVNKAKQYKDPRWLDWFNQTDPTTKAPYGQSPAGLAAYDTARKQVEALQRTELSEGAAQAARAQKIEQEQVTTAIQNQIFQGNPSDPVDPALMARAARANMGDIQSRVVEWRKLAIDGVPSDPRGMLHLYSEMQANPGAANSLVNSAVANHLITQPKDYTDARNLAVSLGQNADGISAALNLDSVKKFDEAINTKTQGGADGITPFNPGGITPDGLRATNDFHMAIIQHVLANPTEPLQDRLVFVNKTAAAIMEALQPNPGSKTETYAPTSATPQDPNNPFKSLAEAPGKAAEAAQKEQQGAAIKGALEKQRPSWWQQTAPEFLGGMSTAEQQSVNQGIDAKEAQVDAAVKAPSAPPAPPAPKVDLPAYKSWVTGLPAPDQERVNAAAKAAAKANGTTPEVERQTIYQKVQEYKAAHPPAPAAPEHHSEVLQAPDLHEQQVALGLAPTDNAVNPAPPGADKAIAAVVAGRGGEQQAEAAIDKAVSGKLAFSEESFPASPAGVHAVNWQAAGENNPAKRTILTSHAIALGLPPASAAAIVGHADAESQFKTTAYNPHGEDSHGMFQWNDRVGRWYGFQRWAERNKRNPEDPIAQIDYAKVEASGIPGPGGQSVWDAVRTAPDLETASRIWMDYFEHPKDPQAQDYADRAQLGQQALRAYERSQQLTSGAPSGSSIQ